MAEQAAAVRRGVAAVDAEHFRSAEFLSQLVHKVGHEIGNPLTSIISLATILERFGGAAAGSAESLGPEKTVSYARSIIDEAWRITGITEKLVLVLSDRPSGKSVCDVQNALQRSLAKLRTRKGIDLDWLHLSLAKEPLIVEADPDQLLVVVAELITNAFAATIRGLPEPADEEQGPAEPPEFLEPPIRIELAPHPDGVVLQVSNQLPHPTPIDDLSQLFDPLVTAHSAGRHVGLGLTMAAVVVQKSGGSLEVEEAPSGDGYRFTVKMRLPRPAEHTIDAGGRRTQSSGPAGGAQQQTRAASVEVLVAEDEATVASAIAKILETAFAPTVKLRCRCVSGEEAVQAIERGDHFDALLCDLNLAGMSGRHVLETLYSHRPDEVGKFAFITGDRMRRETLMYLQSSSRPYLHKPFEPQELIELVRSLIPSS